MNNIGYKIGDRYCNFIDTKLNWLSNYKFNICFENSCSNGYLTEKIFNAFEAGCIPIYWGDPDIDYIINHKSYINVSKFSSFEDAIEEIKKIDNNDELYLNMLKEPIFVSDIDYFTKYNEELDNFLFNIFDKDMKIARNRDSYIIYKIKKILGRI